MFYKNFLIDDRAAGPGLSREFGSRALFQHRDQGKGTPGTPQQPERDGVISDLLIRDNIELASPAPWRGHSRGHTPNPSSPALSILLPNGAVPKTLVQLSH